ncbi:hypothetical protein DFP72DRAFT_871494, partial [Ephemerocybe angulata]
MKLSQVFTSIAATVVLALSATACTPAPCPSGSYLSIIPYPTPPSTYICPGIFTCLPYPTSTSTTTTSTGSAGPALTQAPSV